MKWGKVKAGSLQFAIMISAIIAVLLSVFMILVHTHTLFSKKSDLLIDTIKQADNTLAHGLQNFYAHRDTTSVVINEETNLTGKYHHSYWGILGKTYVQTNARSKSFEKIALVSGWQSQENRTALYLQETNRPLVIVGNTKIEGTSYLPKRGVRAGNISGNSYYGSSLLYGSIKKSTETLPELEKELMVHLKQLQTAALPLSDDDYINIEAGKYFVNSFLKPTKIVFSKNALVLNNITLTGNIIVRSDSKITVRATASLKDVILIAPEIEILDRVEGVFQSIATSKLTVGKKCNLQYPSTLILHGQDAVESSSTSDTQITKEHIFIDEDSTIKGIVIYLQDIANNMFEPQTIISKNTDIEGVVYSQQNIELLGSVHGSIYTRGFITKQFGSVYQNHIYNGVVSSKELRNEFVGYPLDDNNEYKVVKWLY